MTLADTLIPPVRLGVNIDHVATLRNARDGLTPDPIRAAQLACAAGADGITAHLREDRRHIRDADMRRLREVLTVPLNFEMAPTDEMVSLARELKPHASCLVPERREERTTEGGLDVIAGGVELSRQVERLGDVGIRVSLFIAADEAQIRRAAEIGAAVVEFHTGTWCELVARGETQAAEAAFVQLARGAILADKLGLEVHAGHGLDFPTAERISSLREIRELNIGHFLIGEAVFGGLEAAIRQMRGAMARGRATAFGAL